MLVFTFSFNLNLSSTDIKVENMKESNCMQKRMKMSHEVRNTGKYDFHIFIFFFFMKKHNLITVAILDHANRFSSDLVHRHIIFVNPFTS